MIKFRYYKTNSNYNTDKASVISNDDFVIVEDAKKLATHGKEYNFLPSAVSTIVQSITAGTGLTGGTITTSGTVALNLKSANKFGYDTTAVASGGGTSGRIYPVQLDKSGYLAVNVPWSNDTYTAATAAPNAVGTTASVGSSAKYAREDHVHNITKATIESALGITPTANTGTVTSVGLSAPSAFSVSNSPVTTSGTLTLSLKSGYVIPTTTDQTNWNTAYGWGDHSTAGYLKTHQSLSNYATKDYVTQALTSVLTYKGTIGSSGATVTSLPATHKVGYVYVVKTAGTYAGESCEVGDYIICNTDGTSANDAHWDVINGENQVSNKSASLAAAGSTAIIATVDGTDITVTTPSSWTGLSKTGTVTKVTAGTGLTGGDITTTGTIALATSGVTAGTYKRVTVDAYGRVTSGDNTDANDNTWRKVQLNGTDKLGTATNTNPLNIKAGSNMSITESSGTFTFAATDTTYSSATTSAAGLMSAADKTKLNGIATGATNYTYGANVALTTSANYISQPEVKSMKINGSTTNSASSNNCELQYDTTNNCLNFIFN